MVLKLRGLGKTLVGPLPSLPDAGCLRTGQRVYGSHRPPGDAAAGLETTLGELTSSSKGRRDCLVLRVLTPAPSLSPRSVFTFIPFCLGQFPHLPDRLPPFRSFTMSNSQLLFLLLLLPLPLCPSVSPFHSFFPSPSLP